MRSKIAKNTRTIVGLGLLTAIVVVLQFIGSYIKLGMFSVSLVLMPIVVGAALYGAWAGAWLGFVFGVVVLLSGDAALFLSYSVFGTIVTVLLKGTLAGYLAGLVYRLIVKRAEKKTKDAGNAAFEEDPSLKKSRILLGSFSIAGFFFSLFAPISSAAEGNNNLLSMIVYGSPAEGKVSALAVFIVFAVASAVLFFIANISTTVAFRGYRLSAISGLAASAASFVSVLASSVYALSKKGAGVESIGWGVYVLTVVGLVTAWLSVRLLVDKKANEVDAAGRYNFKSNLAVVAAAVVCPIVNTGVFILGCLVFFANDLKALAKGTPYADNLLGFIILVLIGVNFIFELLVNLALSSAIVSLIRTGRQSIAKK